MDNNNNKAQYTLMLIKKNISAKFINDRSTLRR